ncbi:hypothetical protein BaRGS_00004610 [Batillaria attramentaria]|uniref:Uncharacterized protein n=1 Tax=Batillaria attramentaria TaxID=370345 RepID=A0ABD0LYL2_9CAEN
MNQLAAYGSDTDDNESEESLLYDKRKHITSSCDDCVHNDSKDIGLTQPNFFGLDKSEDAANRDAEPQRNVCDDDGRGKLIEIAGSQVHIPDGDFWRDFTVADIPTEGALKTTIFKKRKCTDPSVSQPHVKVKKHFDSSCKCEGDTPWEDLYPKKESCYSFEKSQTNYKSDPAVNIVTVTENSPAVKVYSVHPKIAPHLNTSQTNRCASRQSHCWAAHSCVINRLNWCSAASFSHLLLTASMDTTVRVWNAWAQQQPCVRTLSLHKKAVRDAEWSADGRSILSCSYDRTSAISDVETGQSQVQLEHSSFVSAGKFHPVSPNLLATGTSDCIQVWDTRSPEVPCRVFTYKEQFGQVQDLVFRRDGQEVFSCSDIVTRDSADRSIMAWDFRTGVILSNQIFQERYTVTRLCLHPSTPQLLAQTQAGYIALFSTNRPYKMNRNKRFEGHKMAGYSIGMSVSHDGSLVYSGCAQGKLHCYSFNTGKQIRTLDCGGDVVLDVAAHPVLPSVVACATWGGMLHLFH